MPFGHPIKGDPCGGGNANIHVGDTPPVDTTQIWANTSAVAGCGWNQVPFYVFLPPVEWALLTFDGECVITTDPMNVAVLPPGD